MMTDALATTAPVLAAGWSLLYMLFGGGIGGAILIFIGLKALGRLTLTRDAVDVGQASSATSDSNANRQDAKTAKEKTELSG